MNLGPRTRSFLFWLIFILNVLGALYGFIFFYWQQLLTTPLHLLIFTPDCPLFALFFAISMLLVRYGVKNEFAQLFNFLTFAGALKYGFWTVFVLMAYPEFYYATSLQAVLSTLLLLGHVGLFFEAFLLPSLVRVKAWHLVPVLGFMLLNEYSDYVLLTHPLVPYYALPFLFILTAGASLLFTLGGYWILKTAKRPLLPILSK